MNCYFLPVYADKLTERNENYIHSEIGNDWHNQFNTHSRRMHLLNFLLRPNVEFESILFRLERQHKHWNFEKEKCVAVHLRYGDRIERCKAGKIVHCSFNITVDEYMQKVLIISEKVKANVVFQFTDDESKCLHNNDNLKSEYKHLDFYCMSGKGQMGTRDTVEKDKREELGLIVLALRYAKHCTGFVGNLISNIAQLAIEFMCDHHNGQCPEYYSLDTGNGNERYLS